MSSENRSRGRELAVPAHVDQVEVVVCLGRIAGTLRFVLVNAPLLPPR